MSLPSRSMSLMTLVLFTALPQTARAQGQSPGVVRTETGNRVSEGLPAIPPELIETLNRYQNTRGASLAGWTKDGCLLISTRFAETAQAHRVCQPMGMREQLTFYPEPVSGLTPAPHTAWRDGFVFGKDKGGDEFSQLYWFDADTRSTTLLTDGKRTQNGGTLISRDGGSLAYTSTSRNGTDRDIWLLDTKTRKTRPLVTEGGSWGASDFSPDGKQLLVAKYISANESYPGVVDVASGKLTFFPVDGGKAAFGDFKFAPNGKAVYFVSDKPLDGKSVEFRTLRYHQPGTNEFKALTAQIPWDVDGFEIADDGQHLAYVTNEDGIDKLHVLSLPGHTEVALPALPVGLIGGLDFSPDGKRLALSLNTATSPSDVHVLDLATTRLTRWTQSEVGGLDTKAFVAPTLVRFPTFDQVDGKPRTIPAFYYK
ncbi:MAG: DPP IV N-terminal domain-containing protein, partial [Pseudomonadota bacterium]|nr:DPP IV N-terminal domain-containing protein [Pseudomonadota bacterium]